MCRADLILNWRRNAGTVDRLSALGALSFRPSHPGRDALWMIARSNSLNTEKMAIPEAANTGQRKAAVDSKNILISQFPAVI